MDINLETYFRKHNLLAVSFQFIVTFSLYMTTKQKLFYMFILWAYVQTTAYE